MCSNPTPRASNMGSIKEIHKDFSEFVSEEVFYKKEEMTPKFTDNKTGKKIGKSTD
jgi:hypothetical protein